MPAGRQEIGELLKKSLAKQGLEFHLETKVTGAKVEGDRVDGHAPRPRTASRSTFDCDKVLVGRRPTAYTEGLGLDEVGVDGRPEDREGRRSTRTSARTSRRSRPSAT